MMAPVTRSRHQTVVRRHALAARARSSPDEAAAVARELLAASERVLADKASDVPRSLGR